MAESEQQVVDVEEEDPNKPAYKAPAEKSIEEIMKTDETDESLVKYKQALLGDKQVFWPEDPRKVILRKMSIVVDGRDNQEINLEDKTQLAGLKFKVKEAAKYKLMITFNVQREIVAGLKFHNKISKGPISSKEEYMCGSYGPREEVYEYKSPEEEFPSGMLARGDYKVKSCFLDDDKNELLAWEWKFEIKKEWKD